MLTCKLTSPELRVRKEQVIAALKSKILEIREVHNGYEYKFESTDDMLDQLNEFVKSERVCCDFFDFTISVNKDAACLVISGPEGAKDFIKTELEI